MSIALRTRTSSPSAFSNDLRDLLGWDPRFFGAAPRPAPFEPAFEVKETAEAFVLKADLPGVAEADLEVNVDHDLLSVGGRRTAEERKEGERFALYERKFGAFTRTFKLADTADGENIAATLANGVLTLTIPKKAAAKPRKIAITK